MKLFSVEDAKKLWSAFRRKMRRCGGPCTTKQSFW